MESIDKSAAQRLLDAEIWSEHVLHDMRKKLLDWGRILVLAAGLPLFAVVFSSELYSTNTPWRLSFQLVAVAVLVSGVLAPFSVRWRGLLVASAIVAFVGGALLSFGPTLGTGAMFVAACFIATVFFGLRGLFVASACLGSFLIAISIGNEMHWVTTPNSPDSLWVWSRMTASTLFAAVASSLLFHRTQELLRASLVRDAASRGLAREAELNKEKAMRAAMVSHRLESLGRLAGGVAHEFNNALVVAKSNLELLDDPNHSTERSDLVREIHASLDRATATTHQLLTFAKGDAGSQGVCQPREVMATMQSSLALFMPESITVKFRLESNSFISMPGLVLEQTLMNLMHNARDAMPGGGQLLLESVDDPATSEVVVAVQDSGSGIDESIRAQIFEPFFSTRGTVGTGLGLSMVWGSVTRHGGTIALDPATEKGARFELRFPAVEAAQPSVEADQSDSNSGVMRVLILEDEKPIGKIFHRILTRDGHQVVLTETADEARKAMLDGSYDMLISDAVVPGGGVGEFIESFRERFPEHPVLVCSGYAEDEILLSGIDVGNFDFLSKPFGAAELRRAIESVRKRFADNTANGPA